MAEIISVLMVCMLGGGFLVGWIITKQHYELKLGEAELDYSNRLVKQLHKNKKLQEDYNALAQKIEDVRKAGNSASAAQLNELWREVQNKLSNSEQHQT